MSQRGGSEHKELGKVCFETEVEKDGRMDRMLLILRDRKGGREWKEDLREEERGEGGREGGREGGGRNKEILCERERDERSSHASLPWLWSTSPFLCLAVSLSFCLSVSLSFCLSVFLSLCLSVSLSFSLSLIFLHLSLCLSVRPSVRLFVSSIFFLLYVDLSPPSPLALVSRS